MSRTIAAKDAIKYGPWTYYIYNLTQLYDEGFIRNNWIPSIYSHCAFCKAYRWHSIVEHNGIFRMELTVCDTCNNIITSRPIKIEDN